MQWELCTCRCSRCGFKHQEYVDYGTIDKTQENKQGIKVPRVECDTCLQARVSPEQWERFKASRLALIKAKGNTT